MKKKTDAIAHERNAWSHIIDDLTRKKDDAETRKKVSTRLMTMIALFMQKHSNKNVIHINNYS